MRGISGKNSDFDHAIQPQDAASLTRRSFTGAPPVERRFFEGGFAGFLSEAPPAPPTRRAPPRLGAGDRRPPLRGARRPGAPFPSHISRLGISAAWHRRRAGMLGRFLRANYSPPPPWPPFWGVPGAHRPVRGPPPDGRPQVAPTDGAPSRRAPRIAVAGRASGNPSSAPMCALGHLPPSGGKARQTAGRPLRQTM